MAAGQARQAQLLAEDTRARLTRLRDALPAPQPVQTEPAPVTALDPETRAVMERLRASQAHDATRATSPVPNKIEPVRRPQRTGPGADRGPER